MSAIIVIGMGQSLRGDDGSGPAAVQRWRERNPDSAADPRVHVEIAELPGLSLLDLLAGMTHALLVDAVSSGAPAGRLHLISADRVETFGAGSGSAHGWGAAETLALARKIGSPLPEHLAILGIEAASYDLGAGLSDAVRAALDEAADRIENQVEKWLK